MKKWKKYAGLLLALVLCLSLTACGGGKSNAPATLKNISLDDTIDYNLEDTYDEYLGYWYLEDGGSIFVTENDGKYLYELYDANNEVIFNGQLQYVKEYGCMYVYCEQDGVAYRCRIDHKMFGSEDDNTLYIESFGTFSRASGGDNEIIGNDWRVTGIVRDYGTITRDGEDTVVLVCIHKGNAKFYYDSEVQTPFGCVDYPTTFGDNVWDLFKGIDFSDKNGDGNGDVTMKFTDGDKEIVMVWFWDKESEQFMYQPDESDLGEDEGRGDLITDENDKEDEGRGDLIPDENNKAAVLMGGALPFTNMENLKSENREDGTYYYADTTEDKQTTVVNTVLPRDFSNDAKTLKDYLTDCALSLRETDTYTLKSVEENSEYTQNMTFPVYIVTYTAGENENAREWTVFAMDTDLYTYLYGFCAAPEAADDEMKSIYHDIFAGLYLSDGE